MAINKAKRSLLPNATRHNNRRVSSRHPDQGKPAERRNSTRSSSKKQSALTGQQSTKTHTFTLPRRQVLNFPQAKGRVVREIEFSIDDNYKCLEFRFQDNTTLSFEFEPSFVWEAYFARWKSGEQSILHRWPLRNG